MFLLGEAVEVVLEDGQVVEGEVLESYGWRALVEYPPRTARVVRPIPLAEDEVVAVLPYARRVADGSPRSNAPERFARGSRGVRRA